ncbi:MAG TPA: Ldh family oxidoreductase [Vicinamibacterales bacterium]|nr:Ldh family oxidoreductase [Vicinamibacterales bacterium]
MTRHSPQIPIELLECEGRRSEDLHEVRCEDCLGCGVECRVMRADLERFVADVLRAYALPPSDADVTARVLVAADLRGIASHGVARLGRYINGLQEGYIVPGVRVEIREPAPAVASIDARNAVGQVVSDLAMDMAIARARDHGIGVVTVANSNHYGIAGYYVQKAIDTGMAGLSLTNAAPLVVPTNGADAILGTNPIAFGAPGRDGDDFLLDMATSVVPRGKLEVYDRNRRQMPTGWAVDEKGYDTRNPGHVLANLLARSGGGILPLGGRGEEFAGYKGYGLALMVDVLCGVLSGSAFGPDVDNVRGGPGAMPGAAPRVGHFFLALDISRFMPLEAFRERLASLFTMIRDSGKALDKSLIYIHGEKERVRARLHEQSGIPLTENVMGSLKKIAAGCGVVPPITVAEYLRRRGVEPGEGL